MSVYLVSLVAPTEVSQSYQISLKSEMIKTMGIFDLVSHCKAMPPNECECLRTSRFRSCCGEETLQEADKSDITLTILTRSITRIDINILCAQHLHNLSGRTIRLRGWRLQCRGGEMTPSNVWSILGES